MRTPRNIGGVAAVVALLAAAAITGIAVAGPATPTAAANSPVRSAIRKLTLVTGDEVTASADGRRVSAQPGPGRKGVTFAVRTTDGRVTVVPSDAAPLLAAGRLDARLFDVTGLLAAGYDRREQLPLILTGMPTVDGLTAKRPLPAIGGVAVQQPRGKAAASWRGLTGATGTGSLTAGTGRIWLDGMRRPTLDISVPQIGAPSAWAAGFTGTTVAVLDTGVDDTHPDLAGQVVGRHNFTEGNEPDADLSGHGTHVAATIAGTGAGSGGWYKGVAPGSKLLDGKVCVAAGCAESWIIAGMTWAVAEQHAPVVNLSFGGPDDPAVGGPGRAGGPGPHRPVRHAVRRGGRQHRRRSRGGSHLLARIG